MDDLNVRLDELSDKDVGRWIIWLDPNLQTTKKGRLKSWNNLFAFVVFNCNDQWNKFQNYTPEACAPKECRFLAPYHPVQIQDLPRE